MAYAWETPRISENTFSEADRLLVYEYLREPGWETGWKSNSKKDAYTFLHKHFAGWRRKSEDREREERPEIYDCQDELREKSPLIFNAWRTVRNKVFAGHKLVRCYANGMCYGMDGTVHRDASEPGNYTAVYYPHERWSPNWGGETIFYNQEEDRVWGCMYPKPNSMTIFDGRIPHRANGVTRGYAGMRITLMFKTEKPNGAVVTG